ncbi:3-oxoacyl-[acyl-carrier-protein] synthase III C-terminal domain-containing protein [Pseudovibrio ascidiaceicola]|uniref:3-oxoacyl-[acyl-carrier-protein] synthase III C-terminal domain-containing protein n=1 Tax=Pseudovibrio ascidiaceicola TaxID=285279 RepID=UPI003D35D14C
MLNSLHLANDRLQTVDLQSLGPAYELTPQAAKVYERFYGLKSVATYPDTLPTMLGTTLKCALAQIPDASERNGHLVYCKTQTHNTPTDRNWLWDFAASHGLENWEVHSLSMTSCASALSLLHFARIADLQEPLIVLTGEKAFHWSFSRVSVGLLAEVPCAALFNAGPGIWQVRGTQVRHLCKFYQNPDDMNAADRRELQANYLGSMIQFLQDNLDAYSDRLAEDFIFLPQNLNAPMTHSVVRHFGWEDRTYHGDVQHLGHAYCSDGFLNLVALESNRPETIRPGAQVLILAAGTGVTFSSCLLERQ